MTAKTEHPQSTDRIEKRFEVNAKRSRVWRAISDAREFGTWFGVNLDRPFAVGATVIAAAIRMSTMRSSSAGSSLMPQRTTRMRKASRSSTTFAMPWGSAAPGWPSWVNTSSSTTSSRTTFSTMRPFPGTAGSWAGTRFLLVRDGRESSGQAPLAQPIRWATEAFSIRPLGRLC